MAVAFEILLSAVIVAAVCVPLVMAFDKWKKEMDEDK